MKYRLIGLHYRVYLSDGRVLLSRGSDLRWNQDGASLYLSLHHGEPPQVFMESVGCHVTAVEVISTAVPA